MNSLTHNHKTPDEFEPGCPRCELDEVSMQDTGRPWGVRIGTATAQREAGAA